LIDIVVHPNIYYFASIVLFLIGFYILLTHPNLIKKVIGLNVMDSAIFFFFVAVGFVSDGSPIVEAGSEALTVNPVPSGLMLTGIVVSVSVTAFALAIIIKVYQHYGTINVEEIYVVRSEREC